MGGGRSTSVVEAIAVETITVEAIAVDRQALLRRLPHVLILGGGGVDWRLLLRQSLLKQSLLKQSLLRRLPHVLIMLRQLLMC